MVSVCSWVSLSQACKPAKCMGNMSYIKITPFLTRKNTPKKQHAMPLNVIEQSGTQYLCQKHLFLTRSTCIEHQVPGLAQHIHHNYSEVTAANMSALSP